MRMYVFLGFFTFFLLYIETATLRRILKMTRNENVQRHLFFFNSNSTALPVTWMMCFYLQVVDPRWGTPKDWNDWDTTRDLSTREILECKRLTKTGPNFIVSRYSSGEGQSVVTNCFQTFVLLQTNYFHI